jgi:hypothetical protein
MRFSQLNKDQVQSTRKLCCYPRQPRKIMLSVLLLQKLLPPIGQMVHAAKADGYSCTHDYLVGKATGEVCSI